MKNKITVIVPIAPNQKPKTLETLKKIVKPKNTEIELLISYGNHPSIQRNKALKQAKGEIIFFFDDDMVLDKNILVEALKTFGKNEKIMVVGGPALTTSRDSFKQKSFGFVLSSFFGACGMSSRYKAEGTEREAGEEDLILCNLAARKKLFEKVGFFNEVLYPNEENEYFNRVKKAGLKLIYNPKMIASRSQRKNLRAFVKQLFRYGKGRAEHFIVSPEYFKPLFVVPSVFTLYLFSLLFFNSAWYLSLLGLYVIADLFFSLRIMLEKKSIFGGIVSAFLFPILHVSYGIGFIAGLFWFKFKKKTGFKAEVKKFVL
ncbi:MAG: glycosyltransferase [archaeon]